MQSLAVALPSLSLRGNFFSAFSFPAAFEAYLCAAFSIQWQCSSSIHVSPQVILLMVQPMFSYSPLPVWGALVSLSVSFLFGVARQWACWEACNRDALVLTMYLFTEMI